MNTHSYEDPAGVVTTGDESGGCRLSGLAYLVLVLRASDAESRRLSCRRMPVLHLGEVHINDVNGDEKRPGTHLLD
jgi:hypothetical protein